MDAQRAFDRYATETGQTYMVDSAQFDPKRPVTKAAAADPDVPGTFTYLTPQACQALGDHSWIDFLNGGIGRIYNHYQTCGWEKMEAQSTVTVDGREYPDGAVGFRLTAIMWGSKSTNEVTVRLYVDDMVTHPGSKLTPGNTSLVAKPECEFQQENPGSCSFSNARPTSTFVDLQGGVLEFKVTVNLPEVTAGNPDRKTFFKLAVGIGATSTARIGEFSEFYYLSPAVRCDAAPQDRGGFTTPACIFGGVLPQWSLNTNDSSPHSEVAKHVKKAQTDPNSTLPRYTSGNKIIPNKLHRTTDGNLNKAQRDRATYQCRKWIVPVPSDESCDEYPFASTYEGSFNEPETNYSVAAVNASQNSSEGGSRIAWYLADRILENDEFLVIAYDG